jgi:hypothetical protein
VRLAPLYRVRFSYPEHYRVDGPDVRAFFFCVLTGEAREREIRLDVAEVVWEPPSDDGSLPSSA